METDPRITFHFAEVGEVKLHYATAGSGEKLVILLHGFPELWYSWRHQLAGLSDEYTVVAPDLRGYNLSDKPPNIADYAVEHVVGDIVGLIRQLNREKAAVIGHDWGASIAWALASARSDLLWAVGGLQVPPIPVWQRNQTAAQFLASWYMFFFQLPWLPERFLEHDDLAALARAIQTTTAVPGAISEEEIAVYRAAWKQPFAVTAMLNYYRANIVKRIFSGASNPKKITVPSLFIYGEKDRAVLPSTVKDVASFVDAPYTEHRIPNSGHWVQQEAADEVAEVIRTFLKSTGS